MPCRRSGGRWCAIGVCRLAGLGCPVGGRFRPSLVSATGSGFYPSRQPAAVNWPAVQRRSPFGAARQPRFGGVAQRHPNNAWPQPAGGSLAFDYVERGRKPRLSENAGWCCATPCPMPFVAGCSRSPASPLASRSDGALLIRGHLLLARHRFSALQEGDRQRDYLAVRIVVVVWAGSGGAGERHGGSAGGRGSIPASVSESPAPELGAALVENVGADAS